ncbi:hypothetical protein J6590_001856 [Homalodisca vitripennis]|nr:hypothetical protein J6590_001856 [Homalodisca vitripennis]
MKLKCCFTYALWILQGSFYILGKSVADLETNVKSENCPFQPIRNFVSLDPQKRFKHSVLQVNMKYALETKGFGTRVVGEEEC